MIKKKKLKNFPVQISTAPQNKSDRVTLWVSSGKYNVYDNYEYNYMESDDFAAKLYEEGLKKCVENLRRQGKEKISLIDIGTGKYMDWAANEQSCFNTRGQFNFKRFHFISFLLLNV